MLGQDRVGVFLVANAQAWAGMALPASGPEVMCGNLPEATEGTEGTFSSPSSMSIACNASKTAQCFDENMHT